MGTTLRRTLDTAKRPEMQIPVETNWMSLMSRNVQRGQLDADVSGSAMISESESADPRLLELVESLAAAPARPRAAIGGSADDEAEGLDFCGSGDEEEASTASVATESLASTRMVPTCVSMAVLIVIAVTTVDAVEIYEAGGACLSATCDDGALPVVCELEPGASDDVGLTLLVEASEVDEMTVDRFRF